MKCACMQPSVASAAIATSNGNHASSSAWADLESLLSLSSTTLTTQQPSANRTDSPSSKVQQPGGTAASPLGSSSPPSRWTGSQSYMDPFAELLTPETAKAHSVPLGAPTLQPIPCGFSRTPAGSGIGVGANPALTCAAHGSQNSVSALDACASLSLSASGSFPSAAGKELYQVQMDSPQSRSFPSNDSLPIGLGQAAAQPQAAVSSKSLGDAHSLPASWIAASAASSSPQPFAVGSPRQDGSLSAAENAALPWIQQPQAINDVSRNNDVSKSNNMNIRRTDSWSAWAAASSSEAKQDTGNAVSMPPNRQVSLLDL